MSLKDLATYTTQNPCLYFASKSNSECFLQFQVQFSLPSEKPMIACGGTEVWQGCKTGQAN